MRTIDPLGSARRQLAMELVAGKKRPRNVSPGMNARHRFKKAMSVLNAGKAMEDAASDSIEFPHLLIDYKSENAVVKSKMMNLRDAYQKNKLLRGSGFAWAKAGQLK